MIVLKGECSRYSWYKKAGPAGYKKSPFGGTFQNFICKQSLIS
jgi:hypothetical protein